MKDYSELIRLAEAATPGPWIGLNMVNLDGSAMSADDIGEYVKNCVKKTAMEQAVKDDRFLFISTNGEDQPDICHVGNGPMGPANAAFIAAANPQVVLALIARVKELEAALRLAEKSEHDHMNCDECDGEGEAELCEAYDAAFNAWEKSGFSQ